MENTKIIALDSYRNEIGDSIYFPLHPHGWSLAHISELENAGKYRPTYLEIRPLSDDRWGLVQMLPPYGKCQQP